MEEVAEAIWTSAANLRERRARDFTGSILWHQANRATDYFSRYIELKEGRAAGRL